MSQIFPCTTSQDHWTWTLSPEIQFEPYYLWPVLTCSLHLFLIPFSTCGVQWALGIYPWFGKSNIIGTSICYVEFTWWCRFCARSKRRSEKVTHVSYLLGIDRTSWVLYFWSINRQHLCQKIIQRHSICLPISLKSPKIDIFSAGFFLSSQYTYIQYDPSNQSLTLWTNRGNFVWYLKCDFSPRYSTLT